MSSIDELHVKVEHIDKKSVWVRPIGGKGDLIRAECQYPAQRDKLRPLVGKECRMTLEYEGHAIISATVLGFEPPSEEDDVAAWRKWARSGKDAQDS